MTAKLKQHLQNYNKKLYNMKQQRGGKKMNTSSKVHHHHDSELKMNSEVDESGHHSKLHILINTSIISSRIEA
jgi:type IV secretory pathway VirD2 relaxase